MGVITYIKETKAELAHVTWPTRTDVALFTATIILVSVLTALYLGLFDFLFSRALEMVLPNTVDETELTPQDLINETDEGGQTLPPSDAGSPFDPEAILRGEAGVDTSL